MPRGRKRQATAILEQKGAFVVNPERRNKNEPKPIPGKPETPAIVKEKPLAFVKWNHLCEVLAELGLLSKSDTDLMAIYAVTWATWQTTQRDIWREGMVIEGTRGDKINPKVHENNRAMDRLYKLGAEFGLNPSSRSRLSAVPEKEEDVIGDFMRELGAKNS